MKSLSAGIRLTVPCLGEELRKYSWVERFVLRQRSLVDVAGKSFMG